MREDAAALSLSALETVELTVEDVDHVWWLPQSAPDGYLIITFRSRGVHRCTISGPRRVFRADIARGQTYAIDFGADGQPRVPTAILAH